MFDYDPGYGRDRPVEVLTLSAVFTLTGKETVPDSVPPSICLEGTGDTYRVEDIDKHWPGERISQEEFGRRLRSLRRGMDRKVNPLGVGQALYLILDQTSD